MKYILENDVYLIGDVHGNLRGLSHFITDTDEHNDSNIIVLGDCGIFSDEIPKDWIALDKKAEKKNIKIYIFRGNHDNPDFFKAKNSLDNVIVLEDFDEIAIIKNDECYLGLIYGGALSVDRSWRWMMEKAWNKTLWYKDEVLKPIPDNIETYDFILGHGGITPPTIEADPSFLLNFTSNDPDLMKDIKEEQEQYKKLLDKTEAKLFVYGHFHKSEKFTFNEKKCIALDINEIIKLNDEL